MIHATKARLVSDRPWLSDPKYWITPKFDQHKRELEYQHNCNEMRKISNAKDNDDDSGDKKPTARESPVKKVKAAPQKVREK